MAADKIQLVVWSSGSIQLLCAVALVFAIQDLPYYYYSLLRIFVTATAGYAAHRSIMREGYYGIGWSQECDRTKHAPSGGTISTGIEIKSRLAEEGLEEPN